MLVGASGAEGAFDVSGVVPVDVAGEQCFEFGHGGFREVVVVEHLVLEPAEEPLARAVIGRASLPAHRTGHPYSSIRRSQPGHW